MTSELLDMLYAIRDRLSDMMEEVADYIKILEAPHEEDSEE